MHSTWRYNWHRLIACITLLVYHPANASSALIHAPSAYLNRSWLESSNDRMQLQGPLVCRYSRDAFSVGVIGMMETLAQSYGFILVLGPVFK
jgi:hypothetical protein